MDGDVSPERDIETVITELILADLQTLEKALPRLAKETKFAKDPERARTAAAAQAAQRLLDSGTPLSSGAAAAGIDVRDLRELQLLTAKPFLYVFNMDTSELADEDLRKRLSEMVAPAEAIFLDAKTEADLAELPEEEAAELLAEAGLGEHAGPADLPHRRPEGDPGPGDQGRGDRARGGRCNPHRLPARLHQGRGGLLRRPSAATPPATPASPSSCSPRPPPARLTASPPVLSRPTWPPSPPSARPTFPMGCRSPAHPHAISTRASTSNRRASRGGACGARGKRQPPSHYV